MFGIAPVNTADEFLFGKGSAAVLHRKGNADVGTVLGNPLNIDKGAHKKRAGFIGAFAAFKARCVARADKLRHFAHNGAEGFNFRGGAAVLFRGTAHCRYAKVKHRAA